MSKAKFRLEKVLDIICDIEFIMDSNSLKITQAVENRILKPAIRMNLVRIAEQFSKLKDENEFKILDSFSSKDLKGISAVRNYIAHDYDSTDDNIIEDVIRHNLPELKNIIEESVKIGTHIIKIVDTAGIRDASDVIEKIGIEKSIQAINEADIVIALFDNSKICDDEDEKIIELINENSNKQILKVLNKSDLKNLFDKTKIDDFIELSTKEDINPLIKKVELILDSNTHSDEMTLISKRQIISVENTLYNINLSKNPLDSGELEFFAHYITEALEQISSITRPYENDEMLDVMFGEFCKL
jgi:small GTP-binding protein